MGREAACTCRWAGVETEVKALLESGELILRGGLRRRIPLKEISDLQVSAIGLQFLVGGEHVLLSLGGKAAVSWAKAITEPPPTLARKLGIAGDTVIEVIGSIDDEALIQAIAEGVRDSHRNSALILASVDTMESLQAALRQTRARLQNGTPIWIIYPKGKGHAVSEASIRDLLRATGMIDTKVASVSASLTALRFIRPKSS